MLGYILFGVTLSVFIAYIVISELEYGGIGDVDFGDIFVRLIWSIFWPITALVWVVRRPILRPMWVFIGKGFVFLGRGIAFIGRRIDPVLKPIFRKLASLLWPVLKPISRPVSTLWSRWINHWPESKRPWIRTGTLLAILYTLLAIPSWLLGGRTLAIVYWGLAATALIVMLVFYLRLWLRRKQANSS